MKILMVCLGNICRSPLAQGILEDKVKKNGLHWMVDSAGTSGYHNGEKPHHLSIKVAKENGINISQQQSRKFEIEDIVLFDKIFVMDSYNYDEVKKICGNHFIPQKVELLLNMAHPKQNLNVPDPWYGKEDGYVKVYKMINEACDKMIESLK
jgi:protein-tyrosine phosphatase